MPLAWSTHLAAALTPLWLNPYLLPLGLDHFPACRCWVLVETSRVKEPDYAVFFLDLPSDPTTHLLLPRKSDSQESCLPLVPVQVS